MIIVSQDKNIVVNFDNISHIFIDEWNKTTIKCGRMSGCCEALGHYKTEERAKEVLKEITKAHTGFEIIKHSDTKIKKIFLEILEKDYQYFDTYEMPEE